MSADGTKLTSASSASRSQRCRSVSTGASGSVVSRVVTGGGTVVNAPPPLVGGTVAGGIVGGGAEADAVRSPLIVAVATWNVIVPTESPDRSGAKLTSTVQDSAIAWSVQSSSSTVKPSPTTSTSSTTGAPPPTFTSVTTADDELPTAVSGSSSGEGWTSRTGGSGEAPAEVAATRRARHPLATAAIGRRPAPIGRTPTSCGHRCEGADTRPPRAVSTR